jgi:hypothetical protein
MEEKPETDKWLRGVFSELDLELVVSGNGPDYDAFKSLFDQLPEQSLVSLLGGDVAVEYSDHDKRDYIRPVFLHSTGLVVKEFSEGGKRDKGPVHKVIKGSFCIDPVEEQRIDRGHIDNSLISAQKVGRPMVGVSTRKDNEGNTDVLHLAFNPDGICRDAYLVWSKAYTVEEVRSRSLRQKLLSDGLDGKWIGIQPTHNGYQELFVEAQLRYEKRVKNLHRRVGGNYIKLLSYVADDPTSRG